MILISKKIFNIIASLSLYFSCSGQIIFASEIKLPINLPLTDDSNRISDGISSVSPYQLTSPSFDLYNGPLESGYSTRIDHYHSLTTVGSTTEYAFDVDASKLWNPSKGVVQRWHKYHLSVRGEQLWKDYDIEVNANGYTSKYDAVSNCYKAVGRCLPHLIYPRRQSKQPWMKLICCIGHFTKELVPSLHEERYMPMRENSITQSCFPVGKQATIKAEASGELICYANDGYGLEWNNSGNITVTIIEDST